MIAVVAILLVLAAAITPVVIRRMDRAAWTKEVIDLGAISNALVLQTLKNYSIPDATTNVSTGWAPAAAKWTIRPTSQISTNNRGYARLFLYESGGWIAGNVPFTQTAGGTGANVPSSTRIAIVSTIARALPYTNGAIGSANFSSVWNAAQYTKPSFFSSWTGKGDDLIIQRVNLDSLFHRLILVNRDPTPSPAAYSINSTNTQLLTNLTSSYYLDGTVVGLCSYAVPIYRFALTSDISFTFESGSWHAQLTGGGKDNSATAQSFANQALTFIGTASTPGSHQGADTQGLVSGFYSFMYAYTVWADKCPHFAWTGNSVQAVDYLILDALAKNNGIIDGAAGSQNGLIK